MDIKELLDKLPAETDPEVLNGLLEFATNTLTQIETLTAVNETLRSEYINRFTENVKKADEKEEPETEDKDTLEFDDLFKDGE